MGAKRRQPVYPIRSTVRTLGTLAVLVAMIATFGTASRANAAVEGTAYTGEHFDWTIEWDDDVWQFDKEDNSGNSDYFVLTSRDEYTSSLSFLASTDLPDVEECVNQWAEIVLSSSGAGDYEQLENTDEIDIRPGGGAAVFRYDVVGQTSVIATASYVQCFPLTDDVTIRVAVLTDLKPREATFANVEDVLQTLEESGSDTGTRESTADRDGESRLDEDDDESTRSDDESERGTFDSGRDDDTDRDDDAGEAENTTQDDDTRQGNDDDSSKDEEASDPDAADDDRTGDSNRSDDDDDRRAGDPVATGIDGNAYLSPTYDFTVEWDEEVWTVAPDEELINELPDDLALDRIVLDSDTGSLFIEGRTDFNDGDLEACVDEDIDLLEQSTDITNLEILEDESGDPMEGETDEGVFKVVSLTMEDTNLTEYIECRSIDDGESVLVITLITKASDFEDATDDMLDVTGTIEI